MGPIGQPISPNADATSSPLSTLRALLRTGKVDEALLGLQDWLAENPLSPDGFAALGEAREASGDFDAAMIAFQRALALQKFHLAQRPSAALNRLLDLQAMANGEPPALTLAGRVFPRLTRTRSQTGIRYTSRSHDGKALLKFEIPRGLPDPLTREADRLGTLNVAGCLTAPKLLDRGLLAPDTLRPRLPSPEGTLLGETPVPYIVIEYIPKSSGYGLADVAAALLEQKRCGFYPGQPSPDNIRFDPLAEICRFVRFAQSERLSDEVRALGTRDYFAWCDERARAAGAPHFLSAFPNADPENHFWPLFDGDSFRLFSTYPFQAGRIPPEGIRSALSLTVPEFQLTIDDPSSTDTPPPFDVLPFLPGESALVLNSPVHLHAIALAKRNCKVSAATFDSAPTASGRLWESVLGLSIARLPSDPNRLRLERDFDTLLLCGTPDDEIEVLLALNGPAFAQYGRRILIELAEPEDDASAKAFARRLAASLPGCDVARIHRGNPDHSQWIEFNRTS